jgi:hypothetical protein
VRDPDRIFERLARSAFRRRFKLGQSDLRYLESKGMSAVLTHARRFIDERLAPAEPLNDGRQTPFRGHPVFVAQHATATCCRGCLEKWHGIERGRALTAMEREHVLAVLERWVDTQTVQP